MLVLVAVAASIPLVRLAKAAATSALAIAAVAVKVMPLTVAFWPAAKAENVITDVSATAVLEGTVAKVAALLSTDVYTAVALVVAAEA